MNTKRLTLALVFALLATLVLAIPTLANSDDPEGPQPIYRPDGTIDIGPVLRPQAKEYIEDLEARMAEDGVRQPFQVQATEAYTVGDTLTWLAYDSINAMGQNVIGDIFETEYEVRAVREYCEIWVQTDLNYYNPDGTVNNLHPDAKDPMYVTQEKIDYLADVCNDVIRPTDVKYFGEYNDRDGTEGLEALINQYYGFSVSEVDGKGDRLVVLVSNIRDENFYDPISTGSFIAGFSWGTFNTWGDRNFVTIDSKQWNDRVGKTDSASRSYTYGSTIAHELSHHIHHDQNPGALATWLNEGMAGWAEFLVGYWIREDLGDRTQWQNWPENSITQWGDQNGDLPGEILADYQLVNAFMLYTTGRIGGNYTDTAKLNLYSHEDVLGYNQWLDEEAESNLTFADVFEGFRRDMLHGGYTDDQQPIDYWNADFLGEYESPLDAFEAADVPTSRAYLGELRDNLDREGYDTPGVPPFGSDYIEYCWSDPTTMDLTAFPPVWFDGDETPLPTAWKPITATIIYTPSGDVADDVLFSGHSDEKDNFIIFGPLSIEADDQLAFDHFYNIEDEWDYGFVQVTTDTTGMEGWTSLAMSGTMTVTAEGGHPVIAANVPGFSGFSGGWVTAAYDLGTEYAGEDILLAFRYATDWASAGSTGDYAPGWAIDNVRVGPAAGGGTLWADGTLRDGRSIQEVRGIGPEFSLEFLTWDGLDVNAVYSATLDADQSGWLDMKAISEMDGNFDAAGDRGVFMVSSQLDVQEDLVGGGIQPVYTKYELRGLLPSICTSNVEAHGKTHSGAGIVSGRYVYAGETVTGSIHVDNLGSAPDIEALGPAMVYVGVEEPTNTTWVAGATYTDDLSTVAGDFPAVPGAYWMGTVTDTHDFDVAFDADADLQDGERVTVTAHFAMGEQYITDESIVSVLSPLGLSSLGADKDPVLPGTVSQFTAALINMSPVAKEVLLVTEHPTDTTFLSVTGATNVVTSTTQITITQMISPYAEAGATNLTFQWQLGPSYEMDDMVTSEMTLTDLVTGDTFDLSATADIGAKYKMMLPIVLRQHTN